MPRAASVMSPTTMGRTVRTHTTSMGPRSRTAGGRSGKRRSSPYDAPLTNRSPTSAENAQTATTTAQTRPDHPSGPGAFWVAASTPATTGTGARMRNTVRVPGRGIRLTASPAAQADHAITAAVMRTGSECDASASPSRSPRVKGATIHSARVTQVSGVACTRTQ